MLFEDDHVVLKKATEEQIRAVVTLNYVEWGALLTLEEYIKRESVLGSTACGLSHSVWVLVPKNDPETINFLSSCETYPRPLVYKCPDGSIAEGISHGIASVFTPPSHRGRGYCSTMLTLLRDRFRKESQEKCCLVGSHLFSDIGPLFYDRRGWSLYPSLQVVISSKEAIEFPSFSESSDIQWLTVNDLRSVLESMAQQKIDEMPLESVFIPPRVDTVDWFSKRTEIYSEFQERETSPYVGVQKGPKDEGRSFCIWFKCFKENILYILWMASESFDETRSLLAMAGRVALESNLEQIILWDPQDSEWRDQGQLSSREDSLSSLIFFNGQDSPTRPRHWIQNVKGNWV